MARSREIVKRRRSVANIRKITKTMEMIATAKFKKAFTRASKAKPYTEKLSELLRSLSAGAAELNHPLIRRNESNKVLVLVLTSNRGLAGAYNSSIIRLAQRQLHELRDQGRPTELRLSGKKGIAYFRFVGANAAKTYLEFDDKTPYAAVEKLADEFMDLYARGEIGEVRIVYMRFVSAALQYPHVLSLLPLKPAEKKETEKPALALDQYIFSPTAGEILANLIPMTVRTELFQCFIDAIVTEQTARMRAMKAATDNAEQMIKALGRQYNRARQGQITSELLDIIGGANALA